MSELLSAGDYARCVKRIRRLLSLSLNLANQQDEVRSCIGEALVYAMQSYRPGGGMAFINWLVYAGYRRVLNLLVEADVIRSRKRVVRGYYWPDMDRLAWSGDSRLGWQEIEDLLLHSGVRAGERIERLDPAEPDYWRCFLRHLSARLSNLEREVLWLLVNGYSYAGIVAEKRSQGQVAVVDSKVVDNALSRIRTKADGLARQMVPESASGVPMAYKRSQRAWRGL